MSEELTKLKQENTELKRESEKLKQEINRLKSRLNYLEQIKAALDKTTIISKTDTKGIITDANEMFEKISGYSKEELIGKPHNIVRHPEMPKAVFKKMWDTIQKGKIFKGIVRNRKKDGSDYYVLANIIPITDENGQISEYIAIRQDITKRMRLQQEKENFINLLITYFSKQIKSPVQSIAISSKDITHNIENDTFDKKFITQKNNNILKNVYLLEKNYNTLKTIRQLKENKLKMHIEPLYVTKILSHLIKKYYKLYNKKISFKNCQKDTIINTDKILFLLMLEILYVNILSSKNKEIKITLFKENANPILIFETKEKIPLEEIKTLNLFQQLSKNSKNGLDMYLVQKILDLFNYKLITNTEKDKNEIILKLNTIPPKNLLN